MASPPSTPKGPQTASLPSLPFDKRKKQLIDDEEWEVEETTTLFEFGKELTSKHLSDAHYQCKMIGIESETPFLQIGSLIFQGQCKEALGQDMVFSVTPDTAEGSTQPEEGIRLEHVLSHRYCFEKVVLKPKEPTTTPPLDR